ncbi:hypothetical protein R8Z50_19095 [Longispora sp. K20-0274]|uniref:hypothetical protein n=1 Tax=Longispora sp. K20-0274 TaxID=3088255 RepID=UPI00399A3791
MRNLRHVDQRLCVATGKDEIKGAPELDETRNSEADYRDKYRDELGGYYGGFMGPVR